MLAIRRGPGPLLLPILLAGLPAVLAAEPIHVSGRVQIPAETVQGLAGARVELLPQNGEVPVATAKSDAAGFFELTAPGSGCFRVRMRAEGYRKVEAPFLPLAEDQDLAAVPAVPASPEAFAGLEIDAGWAFDAPAPAQTSPAPSRLVQGKVRDLKGAPVAGALVWSEGDPGVSCVKAGADGGFQIRLPASGEAKLRAVGAGYLLSDPKPAPRGQGPPLVLALAPAGSITGRVVDAAGQPLARVQIRATPDPWEGGPSRSWAWSRADGRFRLSRLPPGKLYEMAATRDGFAPASVKADALSSPKPVRIVLERGATVLGMVLDPEGQPVPGAELDATLSRSNRVILGLSKVGEPAGKAVSDAAGSFAVSHLGIGRFDLRVKRKGFETLSVPGIEVADRAARIDLGALTLNRGAVVEGRVTGPDGAPLPEARVTLSPAPDPLARGLSVPGPYFSGTSTDSEGHFRFEDLRRGARFNLRVEHFGFLTAGVSAVEAPTPEPLRIELKAGRTVAGRVKSPEGEPVPQARVMVSSASGYTDEGGRFRIAGVWPGVAELTVDADGYPRVIQSLQIPEESDVEGLEIALNKGSVLEVQVLDSRRQPVAGIFVSAYAHVQRSIYFEGDGSHDCSTDPEGRCRIGELVTGLYDVLAQSEKYGLTRGSVEIGPGINRQELVLPPGALVSGRVSDETGAPVAGASLSLNPVGSGRSFQAASLGDGSFQFSAVSEGAYRLSGSAPGFTPAAAPDEVQVAGQEVGGLALRLSRGVTLTGRVLGLNPEELASTSVSVAGASRSVRVGWDGRYELTDLAPGEWMISAQARGRAVQEPLQIAPGAREAVLDLRFPSGYTLTGHVTADRAPLAGAQVQASSSGGSFQGVAGPDGGFQIPNVPPGHYSVTASDGPLLKTSVAVEVTGDQEVNLDLITGGLGVVVLAGGAPVVNAFVDIPGGAGWATDAAGRLAIPRLTPGAYTVYVQKGGFAPVQMSVEVRPGEVAAVRIELQPAP